jgi:hypothetical protein
MAAVPVLSLHGLEPTSDLQNAMLFAGDLGNENVLEAQLSKMDISAAVCLLFRSVSCRTRQSSSSTSTSRSHDGNLNRSGKNSTNADNGVDIGCNSSSSSQSSQSSADSSREGCPGFWRSSELLEMVLEHLSADELVRMGATCRRLWMLISRDTPDEQASNSSSDSSSVVGGGVSSRLWLRLLQRHRFVFSPGQVVRAMCLQQPYSRPNSEYTAAAAAAAAAPDTLGDAYVYSASQSHPRDTLLFVFGKPILSPQDVKRVPLTLAAVFDAVDNPSADASAEADAATAAQCTRSEALRLFDLCHLRMRRRVCPRCQQPKSVVPVLYGFPSAGLCQLRRDGQVLFGGDAFRSGAALWVRHPTHLLFLSFIFRSCLPVCLSIFANSHANPNAGPNVNPSPLHMPKQRRHVAETSAGVSSLSLPSSSVGCVWSTPGQQLALTTPALPLALVFDVVMEALSSLRIRGKRSMLSTRCRRCI